MRARNEFDRERVALQQRFSDLAEQRTKARDSGANPETIRRLAMAEQTAFVFARQKIDQREQQSRLDAIVEANKAQMDAARERAQAERAEQIKTQELVGDLVVARLEAAGRMQEAQAARIIAASERARTDGLAAQRQTEQEVQPVVRAVGTVREAVDSARRAIEDLRRDVGRQHGIAL